MRTLTALCLICIAASCNNSAPDSQLLKEVDRAFSKMSQEQGLKKAFLFYAAEDVIKLQNKHFPIKGKEALKQFYAEATDEPVLTWEPEKADLAGSGDLGYTFGNWRMLIRDSAMVDTFYGNYMTVWKKQADGSWKFVLDGGNSTPKPGSK